MGSIIGIYRKGSGDIAPPTKINVTHEGFSSNKQSRQMSFITLEGENSLREGVVKGFCHTKFKADFVVEGLCHTEIKPTDKIAIGSAIIEVTEVGKDCFEICPAITRKGSCGVNEMIFFGRIIKEGLVKINDRMKLL